MTKWYLVSVSIVCAAAVGCGGGGGMPSPTPTSQSTKVGTAMVTFTGKPQVITGGQVGGVSVAGLSGASVSALIDYPAQVLGNTQIVYTQVGSGGSAFLKLYDFCDGSITYATNLGQSGGGLGENGTFTHDGHLCFLNFPNGSSTAVVAECNYDGSGVTQLSHASTNVNYGFDVSPNNQYLVYADGTQLYRSAFNGTGEIVLVPAINHIQLPSISPDGTTVAYQGTLTASGISQIFTVPIAGGTPTQITHLTTNNAYCPKWTPDGKWLAYTLLVTSSPSQTGFVRVADGLSYSVQQASTTLQQTTVSPDGTKLVCAASPSSGGNTYLEVTELDGGTPTTIVPLDQAGSSTFPVWSPFPGSKKFIGTNGSMFQTAAGFLMSQYQSAFRSLVAFSATTPSTATITLASGSGGTGSLVYDLHADTILAWKYVNGYYLPAVQLQNSTSDILVSIDSQTGHIDSVAPAIVVRGAKAMVARSGGGSVITGRFTALYDGKGKNLAPNGATSYSLDTNGKVVSVQP